MQLACNACNISFDVNKLVAACQILLKYNSRINPRTEEVSAEQIFSEIICLLDAPDKVLRLFIEKFFEYFQREAGPEETALELLHHLKRNNIKTAVLTDVPYGMPKNLVRQDLGELAPYIDLLVSSVDIGYRKPSPKGLEYILKHFNVSAEETILIGNEKKDIETAKALVVCSVLINQDTNPPDWGQNITIRKLIEVNFSVK